MLADEYQTAWAGLNSELKHREQTRGILTDALLELEMHQKRAGFIRDDLHEISRYTYVNPSHPFSYIRVQYNPRRALRFHGSGINVPPDGMRSVNNGCFLCRDNIQWQQEGRELGYEIDIMDTQYYAWMNPFPLLPCHVVITTRQHVPQEWELHPDGSLPLEQLVGNLVELAVRLPRFIGFYNGINAGASIPGHMHYQFCMRPEDDVTFPLEQAERDYTLYDHTGIVKHYPMAIAAWQGQPETVVHQAVHWVRYWSERNSPYMQQLTANFIVSSDPQTGEISLFFAPRNRNRSRSRHMSGLIGGLEVLGELVFSSDEERALIDEKKLDYFELKKVYEDVYTPLFIKDPGELDTES